VNTDNKKSLENKDYIGSTGMEYPDGYIHVHKIEKYIDCHFIFNALNTIKYSVITGNYDTCSLIDNLADYMRYRINAVCSFEMVSFKEEIKHMKSYITLEQARFSCLHTEYNFKDTDFTLPSMSVIFLAENAIHHGILKRKGAGRLQVTSYAMEGFHCIEICDDGAGMGSNERYPDSPDNGPGSIISIAKRLETMADASLSFLETHGQGTKAVIKIPS